MVSVDVTGFMTLNFKRLVAPVRGLKLYDKCWHVLCYQVGSRFIAPVMHLLYAQIYLKVWLYTGGVLDVEYQYYGLK